MVDSYEYFNRNYGGQEYDPVKRRSKSKGAKLVSRGAAAAPGRPASKAGKENDRLGTKSKPAVSNARVRAKRAAGESSAAATVPAELLEKAEVQIQDLGVVVRDLEKVRFLHICTFYLLLICALVIQERYEWR
jgi:hypothetical protein